MHVKVEQAGTEFKYFKEYTKDHYESIENELGEEAQQFIAKYSSMENSGSEMILTSEAINIEAINGSLPGKLVSLKKVNDIADVNLFLRQANGTLPVNGIFVCCLESIGARRKRIMNGFPTVIAYPFYFFDFLFMRVFPKLKITGKLSSIYNRKNTRAMSVTETLGRLFLCGFDVIEYAEIERLTYFVCKKMKKPSPNGSENCGLIIQLERIGKDGKTFHVYKLRTMHPYSEYVQDYVYQKYGLSNGDKFKDDFRVTSWGRFLRKFWLDEQPMWINYFKGDLKLVGVRPLSKQKLSVYPEELRARRTKHKPGLIPPAYADLPQSNDDFFSCESKYLDAYEKSSFGTDFKYFWKVFYNILFKRARSA